jgi:hypothetical protein
MHIYVVNYWGEPSRDSFFQAVISARSREDAKKILLENVIDPIDISISEPMPVIVRGLICQAALSD